jgi:hypothetical protein
VKEVMEPIREEILLDPEWKRVGMITRKDIFNLLEIKTDLAG